MAMLALPMSNATRTRTATGTGMLSPSSTPSRNSSAQMQNSAFYGHFLCLGDQSNNTSCQDCVTSAVTDLPVKCPASEVARIFSDKCTVRYSNESLLLPVVPPKQPSPPPGVMVPTSNATETGVGTRIISPSTRRNMSLDVFEGNPSLDNLEELPLFKFEKLSAATNNFHENNKLGQGGFGLVYKGTLEDGQEVAIKRLSRTSTQGVEEFMNEVLVISKLQHRNLVKLLGCCTERRERMLVYDYMPNKSLDAFLFDPQKKGILDWKKRYNIIEGISRGLLYLHRDSRLKIIHRDLKAANILLDENLNPKISDFGMARIFGGAQMEAETRRVVGTYGYMPPEYAIEGRFSEKSDVFSYGVLLLEIITGKKTRWFDESSLSLLGYVWKQWNEDNYISLIDPTIDYQGFETEISKCIHLGLLCVQEYAQDRPGISDVVAKLGASSTATFPKPKQPGFTRFMRDTSTSTQSHRTSSNNDLSITNISGR